MAPDTEHTLHVGPHGDTALPEDLLRELAVTEGSTLRARVSKGALVLEPPGAVLARLRRHFTSNPERRSLADELTRDRRAEAARELSD